MPCPPPPTTPFAFLFSLGLGLVLTLALPQSGTAAEPPALFLRACAPCHGKDGKAGTPAGRQLGVKDVTLSKLTEAELRQQILDGKKGPDGTSKMPAFGQTLKPAEIDALARFVKSLQRSGNP